MLTFLSAAEKSAILLEREVDLNQVGAGQQLYDHAGGVDGGDAKFHESTAVRGQDDTHPVKWIGGVRRHDTVQRDLRTDKENQEGDGGP